MTNDKLIELLKEDVEEWNQWRKMNPHQRFSFIEPNLAGAKLAGANLSQISLFVADLTGTDLSGADLSKSHLTGSDLTGAILTGADLSGADLSAANLSNVILINTSLQGANVTGTVFTGTTFNMVTLSGVDFTEAILKGSDLSGMDLSGIDLTRTNLTGANLSEANLNGSKLTDANLREANLTGTDLSGADLSGTSFYDCSTLIQAVGLDKVVYSDLFPIKIDVLTLRASAIHLPDHFLLGAGYVAEELPRLRNMYGGKEVPAEDPNTLTLRFDFPEEVRTKCKQYLLFFKEFLIELGVKAKTGVEEGDAGDVLFSVTPEDKTIALYKIREALDVYRLLPAVPNLQGPSLLDHPALYLVKKEIDDLKQAVQIKETLIQQKDTIIQFKDETIQRQQERINAGTVMIDYYKGPVSPELPKEPPSSIDFLDGRFQITPLGGDGQGFRADLPRIIRDFPVLHNLCKLVNHMAYWFVQEDRSGKTGEFIEGEVISKSNEPEVTKELSPPE